MPNSFVIKCDTSSDSFLEGDNMKKVSWEKGGE